MTTSSNLASDATQMLAAALEQMDDIIAGTRYQSSEVSSLHNGTMDSHNANFSSSSTSISVNHFGISQQADDLKQSVEMALDRGEAGISREGIPESTRRVLTRWLQGNSYQVNGPTPVVSSEQVQRLEGDKESLVLQLAVLNDQVEAQSEAIQEMERGLADEAVKLTKTEAMLQEEMMARAELESTKLNQMTEVSNLRIRLSTVENDLSNYRERTLKAESLLEEKQKESGELSVKYQKSQNKISELQGESNTWQEKYMQSQGENERLQAAHYKEVDYATEIEKLKRAVESLLAANNEKDKKIDDLKKSVSRYKKVQELMLNAQGRRADGSMMDDDPIRSDSFSTSSSVSMADTDESSTNRREPRMENQPDVATKSTPEVILRVGSPLHSLTDTDRNNSLNREVPLSGKGSTEDDIKFQKRKSASLEDLKPGTLSFTNDSTTSAHHQGYSTLPSPRSKSKEFQFTQPNPVTMTQHQTMTQGSPESRRERKDRSGSFGRGLFKVRGSKKTSSAPNLASTESDNEDIIRRNRRVNFADQPDTPPAERRKKKVGIKKLFGKLKRSNSATLTFAEEDEDSSIGFQRGGRLRATAGPRIGWAGFRTNKDSDAPFAKWESDQVAAWLHDMGLGQYMSMCRVWVKNGATLLKASPLDLERELGVKNVLHRKKIQLALQAIGSEEEDKFSLLDHNWVLRWLDDAGLPQYKDAFSEAKVDGRMLHYLTVDDLLLMRVTSGMHHVSIMRGIQCLRLHHFQPNCLRRRPTDEPYEACREVMLWTNHRVMEWLRTVDLSEYAPNLRGSGIHGALMVLEPRFSAETLAATLCIPNSKSLLRRHLSTHFVSLVGSQIQAQKRESEKASGYVPLSALSKIKPKKRPFGGRPKKRGMEEEDYVCPMNLEAPLAVQGMRDGLQNGTKGSNYRIEVRGADKVHKQEDESSVSSPDSADGNAPSQIGAFSQEINSLTSMLNNDKAENGGTNV
ncbi:liprin-beta-1-like isoform X2 [Asterias amurensis]|uniref:liprin-beta-1-like isoform X2 n=1 Tax=Asterias amurensis TaxID=7602 RepID=UPI003AB45135